MKKTLLTLIKITSTILLIAAFIYGTICWVYFAATFGKLDWLKDHSQIGDAVGGLTAPIIGLAGAILVFYSFQAQLRANRMQFNALEEDRKRYAADRWYSNYDMTISEIKACFVNLKLRIPVGENDSELRYDKVLEFENFIASGILIEKLKAYTDLNQFERYALDFYIFEFGYYLKQIQQTGFNIFLEQSHPTETDILMRNIAALFSGNVRFNLNAIIENLNDKNDPKFLKGELVKTKNFIENMIIESNQNKSNS